MATLTDFCPSSASDYSVAQILYPDKASRIPSSWQRRLVTYQCSRHQQQPAAAASAAKTRHHPPGHLRSGKNTLRIRIDLQSLLRELRLAEEVQRHPHQMTLDPVELAPHLAGRAEQVVDVTRLVLAGAVAGQEAAVVVHGADCEDGDVLAARARK